VCAHDHRAQPARISLGGGGTDLPSYYRRHGGFLIASAIDKYVYITLHQTFVPELIVKYSKLERVRSARELQHPIIREALRLLEIDGQYLEITSMADIPAGTGLGSSGSFTTALLTALHVYKKNVVHAREIAEQACQIEIERVGEPVGKQDQYIAAFGGLTCMDFHADDSVHVAPLKLDHETLYNLEDNLLLFFTGYSRAAAAILKEQDDRSRVDDREMVENLHYVKELGQRSREALEAGNLRQLAELMNVHWQHKKKRSGAMTNGAIDAWYDLAMANGALGGKLIGAGGGGFLLFYAEDKTRLRHAMAATPVTEVRFRFDFAGRKSSSSERAARHRRGADGDPGGGLATGWALWSSACPRLSSSWRGGLSSTTSSPSCTKRASGGWCSASAIKERRSRPTWATAPRAGSSCATPTTAPVCWGRAGRSCGRLLCWGRPSGWSTGTPTRTWTSARLWRASPGAPPSA
jgi:D-glycero-alpha-D-manno-heptose-7-phosphate kinase